MILALSVAPRSACAQNAQLIATGREQFENLQYEEAIQSLSAAIIRRGNTVAQEAQIYETLALSYLALSRDAEADGAFRLMLAKQPDRTLPNDLSPRIREFFEATRRRWETDGRPGIAQPNVPQRVDRPITLVHVSPAEQQPGHAIELTTSLTDPDRRAAGVVLAWRQGSRGLFHRVEATRESGVFRATIAAAEVRPPVVEYYFEAVDPNHLAVAARGDAFAPLRVVVPEARATPLTSRWWFWTGAAVLVAGVAVGSYFIFSGGGEAAPARLTVNVTGN